MSKFNISVTGHRPNKLWGYDYNHPMWELLKERLKQLIIHAATNHSIVNAVSGMALGVDTIFAQAAIEARELHPHVRFIAAVPCKDQECMWPSTSQRLYHSLLKRADKVVMVSEQRYHNGCMQKRNKFMVDHSNMVIAVWNGSRSGGTAHCVNYAKEKAVPTHIIHPKEVN